MTQEHYARIADLYDAFVNTQADLAFFEDAAPPDGDVLELMCGTGRLTLPLLAAGIQVTALDYSDDMLAVLRGKLTERGLNIPVHQADVRNFDLGRTFPQVILPFQAFPELTQPTDQRAALTAIYRHVAPGGTFICTLHNPAVRRQSIDEAYRLAARVPYNGGQLMVWLLQRMDTTDVAEVLEFFEIYDADGAMTDKRTSSLRFHLLKGADFEAMATDSGFIVADVYGNYERGPFQPGTSPFMIYKLQRPESPA